ncbi:MAG TPA: histidine kinase [Actinocrinis sp.]|jgi:signal transduction histidine kinase
MVRTIAAWLRCPSGPAPRPSRRALLIDAVLALVLVLYALSAVRGVGSAYGLSLKLGTAKGTEGPGAGVYITAVVTTAPLAWRRRYPFAVFWIVTGMTVAQPGWIGAPAKLMACAIAAYSVAAHSPYQRAALISLAGAAVAIAGIYQNAVPNMPKTLGEFLVIAPVVAAGAGMRSLQVRIAEARQRERALEQDTARAAELATQRERARIARELHDVITHNVSVMVVQAGAARKIMSRAPERAASALLVVESAGRAAMTELQHAMGLLAADGEEQLAPQPGLAVLGQLISRVRATGMRVDLAETGVPQPLAPGADLAAYRVVQEALTNAAKHAAGAATRVRIDYTPRDLTVGVDNSAGRHAPNAAEGNGRGLIGLRERLTACGGRLHAGPRGDGGFEVRAVIPLQVQDAVEAR